jgi:uncharacterized phage protein (TIGR02220 family)
VRIRTIKPEFFRHAELYDLEHASRLPIRLAFAGLWCACDRRGRFKWRPRELKIQILPYDDCDFSRVLDALTTRGFVVPYACPTRDDACSDASFEPQFGWIPSFERHQVINNREKESELPDPCDATTSTRAPRVPHACPTPLNLDQEEGKGKEGKGTRKGKEQGSEVAVRVLGFLNSKTGSQFRAVETHLKAIDARLSELGVDEAGILKMITRQVLLWKDNPKMSEFLRPQTLFGKEKFQSYYDQRELPVTSSTPNGSHRPTVADERNRFIGGSEVWEATSGKLALEEGKGFGIE